MTGDREPLFDGWAPTYDTGLEHPEGFPFEGYGNVLEAATQHVQPGQRVLDVGTGTGALAARLAAKGCDVVGVDFSEAMLAQARGKVPDARFLKLDLLGTESSEEWEALQGERFDRIVSAYVFHEFPLATKVALLRRLSALLSPGGVAVVGDVAFGDAASRAVARRQWGRVWDDSEHYWAAAEDARVLEGAGFRVQYTQISFCAGVFVVAP